MGLVSTDFGTPRKCSSSADKVDVVQSYNENFSNIWDALNKLKSAINENYTELSDDGTIGLVLRSVSDDGASKNSVYYSTTRGAVAYKDKSGNVNLINMA